MRVSWQGLYDEIYACEKCGLCRNIHNKVPGQGDVNASLMFIGEGPGADEDLQGLAFVGAAGQLLTKMISAMGMTREKVYICNIVKCRPPQNRVPDPAEAAACLPYLRQQVALVRPRVIVLLGSTAVSVTGQPDRFDLPDDAHWHVICDKCGQVKDIPVDRDIIERIERDADEKITSYLLTAHCTCKKCREAELNQLIKK